MGRLRELDRAAERRWPSLTEPLGAGGRATVLVGLLAAGSVLSLLLHDAADPSASFAVLLGTCSTALGLAVALRRVL